MDRPPRHMGTSFSIDQLDDLMNKIYAEKCKLEAEYEKKMDYLCDLSLSIEYCRFLIEERDYWKGKANE